ncbi:DEAD/DEAH box helicase [Gorillibacterium timonense]|uniref:DEAD/DEAH box helicase n=1 Tax=Gorillibacterium timonense TaxID=1689269 RepID=UPI0009E8F6D2|nr:DEAD/DEAH box helicase [Gorillibacterium timonense]
MNFQDLKLIPPILKALAKENYTTPTPIQEQSIPAVLAGRDLLGCAQTGTGKTAAFALPILQLLNQQPVAAGPVRRIRSLILTPTRELAIQIADNLKAYSSYTRIKSVVVVGGVSQKPQELALKQGTDILIATPGRLLDLVNQKHVDLQHIQILVLDEADRMLDMGFIHDVKRIIAKLPVKRQTLFFSATMPTEIANLVKSLLVNPVKIEIHPVSSTVDRIEQRLYKVDKENKPKLLKLLLQDSSIASALVFTRTKHGADRVVRDLTKAGISAQAIHGNKSQNARQTALGNFKSGATRVLVATDIAARGIDIEELSHVVNFNLPNIPETYVHRIGRTGRAGLSGVAISFCEAEELPYLKDIQKLTGKLIPEVKDHPYPMVNLEPVPTTDAAPQGGSRNARGRRGSDASRNQASPRPAKSGKKQQGVGGPAAASVKSVKESPGNPGGGKAKPKQERPHNEAASAKARPASVQQPSAGSKSGSARQSAGAMKAGSSHAQQSANGRKPGSSSERQSAAPAKARTSAPAQDRQPVPAARIWPDPKPAPGSRQPNGKRPSHQK